MIGFAGISGGPEMIEATRVPGDLSGLDEASGGGAFVSPKEGALSGEVAGDVWVGIAL